MRILLPTLDNLLIAADALREGKLVIIPTETVYGLAANAFNQNSIARMYQAKGRPSDHPVIVHVCSIAQAREVAGTWSSTAEGLAHQCWPGALTLVVPKSESIPFKVTAGLDTVGVRMPSHPVAREIIRLAGVPLAAPSANPFMGISPTRPEHIDPRILQSAEFLINGGRCEVGIESTVIDVSVEPPVILRPGGIPRLKIEQALGQVVRTSDTSSNKSPGQHHRHYSPRAQLQIVDQVTQGPALVFEEPVAGQIRMPDDPEGYAHMLYEALHTLDSQGVARIEVQAPPKTAEWDAIWDRLTRASGDKDAR